MRPHELPQQRIDACLVPGPLGLEPCQYICIQTQGDLFLRLDRPQSHAHNRAGKLLRADFRDIRRIDFFITHFAQMFKIASQSI